MKSKIRVHGKSHSRTALGIINAYLKLNPDTTLSGLQRAFPKSLYHKSHTDNIIVPVKETQGHEKMFFEHEDELIVLKSGEKLALVEIWSKDDFAAICEHAKQYGIETAEEGTKPFEKGSFVLEYLQPEDVQGNDGKKKRKFKWWWLLLLILLLLLIIIFCCKKCCCSDTCSNSAAEDVTPELTIPVLSDTAATENDENETNSLIVDTGDAISFTLPDGTVWKIGKNSPEFQLFNFLNTPDVQVDADQTRGWITLDKLHFETGKTKLTSESENQLKSIAMIMKFFPNSRIRVGGYTDNTGTDEVNKRVSLERARVTAEKLISSDIAANRVSYEGYGSQRPVCPANDSENCRASNRRVDIRVTQK